MATGDAGVMYSVANVCVNAYSLWQHNQFTASHGAFFHDIGVLSDHSLIVLFKCDRSWISILILSQACEISFS